MNEFELLSFLIIGLFCVVNYLLSRALDKFLPHPSSPGPLLLKLPPGRWATVEWSADEEELHRRIVKAIDDNKKPGKPTAQKPPTPTQGS